MSLRSFALVIIVIFSHLFNALIIIQCSVSKLFPEKKYLKINRRKMYCPGATLSNRA